MAFKLTARRSLATVLFALLTTSLPLLAAPTVSAANTHGESLKLVAKPGVVSLTKFSEEEFSIEVSGFSQQHAQLAIFLQLDSGASCARTAPEEAKVEGAAGQNPAQKEAYNVEKYPANMETNFTGPFDWDSNTLTFINGVKPGLKLVCGYISPVKDTIYTPPSAEEVRIADEKESPAPEGTTTFSAPYVAASTRIDLVEGVAHGYVSPRTSRRHR
jgi:hypothetical protein